MHMAFEMFKNIRTFAYDILAKGKWYQKQNFVFCDVPLIIGNPIIVLMNPLLWFEW